MILTRVAAMLVVAMALMEFWGTSGAVLRDYRMMSKNVSSTLDMLLNKSRYDKRIRPGFGGPPVKITVNLHIKSMGPVSETDQNYLMDCYFRQTWYDKRLVYNLPGMEEFSMSWLFLDRVWKPDTFFLNGKKSYLHRITVPNKFLRLRSNGFIVYSMRLTIKASCRMHLRKFPLDSQTCPLFIGSYGYASNDVIYQWESVSIEDNVELSQYQLVNITTESEQIFKRGVEDYSVVKVTFHMQRNIGFFILQLYVPCGLIVCCSWVSFWIDPDAVPARVSLGVTTVLSMTTMGFGGRAQMPKVSYATALDSFVIICFSFVFAVMIEYACINFLDTVTSELKKIITDRSKKKSSPPKDAASDPLVQPRSVSMIDISPTTGHIYAEIGGAADEETGRLKAPGIGERRKSLVELAAPLIDSLKRNLERRKSEISIRLPAILTPSSQRRKSEASIRKPPVPLIKVQTDDETATIVMEDEQGHGPKTESAGRDPGRDDFADICCDDNGDDDEFEDEEEQEDEDEIDEDGIIRRVFRWIGKAMVVTWCFFMRPWKAWKEAKIIPQEEDVLKQMQSGEEKEKFSRIDIQARLYFPIAFCFLISIYWILYLYYITDDFPEKEPNPHLNPSRKS